MNLAEGAESLFLNRELSLLKFNERVLALAENSQIPLLERLRYVCIVSSNLDEFFEIRISSLKVQQRLAPEAVGIEGLTAKEVFDQVEKNIHQLVSRQYALLNEEIFPCMQSEGIVVHHASQWNAPQLHWAREIFNSDIMPLLTPIGLDPAHPFPRVTNKSLNFIVPLGGIDAYGRKANIAIVQAPRALPRFIKMPVELSLYPHSYVFLTSLIRAFVSQLFIGLHAQECYQWRVTRNSELFVDEEEVTNLPKALQSELSQRLYRDAVRLEIDKLMPKHLEKFLQKEFSLSPADTYRVNGPVNLSRLTRLCDVVNRKDLLFPEHYPSHPATFAQFDSHSAEFFSAIAQQDYLLHHPYQSFQPVIDFLRAAALDPQVMAIKQTIYRTGADSELMQILISAAKAGKEVTVVVELMARFDEQTNIDWAGRLEEAGAHVVFGVVGHKTHAKMVVVLRREQGRLRRYAHLSTGNYHPRTARFYTDFSLFTAEPDLSEDTDKIFAQLTGLGAQRQMKLLLQSPFTLHDAMLNLIRSETDAARSGKKAHIMAKMNALLEKTIIEALYEASQAGVQIDLIVRGACALRAGVIGLSENIQVRSIVGRFLEHARAFYFYAHGQELVYLSSADWMDRNFFRRVEIAFPVIDRKLKQRVITEAFDIALKDTELAWQQRQGDYKRISQTGLQKVNTHTCLIKMFE